MCIPYPNEIEWVECGIGLLGLLRGFPRSSSTQRKERDEVMTTSQKRIAYVMGWFLALLVGCSPPLTLEPEKPSCDEPMQTFGAVQADAGNVTTVQAKVCAGYRYTACTQNPKGDPNLLGNASGAPTVASAEVSSKNGTMFVDDGNGGMMEVARQDCVSFETKTEGTYYLGIHANGKASSANIWVAGSPLSDIPEGYEGTLTWPLPTCSKLTFEKWGPFNAAWGNDISDPFFTDGPYQDYLHGGVDIDCPAGSEVVAPYDGTITDSNDAGGTWGWHTVVDSEARNGVVMSTVIIHVNQASTLPIGTKVKAGQVIATIFPLVDPGEKEHGHITMSRKSHDESEAARAHPERGACRQSEWANARKFWFNPMDPALYKNFPTK